MHWISPLSFPSGAKSSSSSTMGSLSSSDRLLLLLSVAGAGFGCTVTMGFGGTAAAAAAAAGGFAGAIGTGFGTETIAFGGTSCSTVRAATGLGTGGETDTVAATGLLIMGSGKAARAALTRASIAGCSPTDECGTATATKFCCCCGRCNCCGCCTAAWELADVCTEKRRG